MKPRQRSHITEKGCNKPAEKQASTKVKMVTAMIQEIGSIGATITERISKKGQELSQEKSSTTDDTDSPPCLLLVPTDRCLIPNSLSRNAVHNEILAPVKPLISLPST
jgi:ribosomal protein S16